MANEVLGKCACPLCGYPNQEVRQTSKTNPKPYLCCEDCHAQIFARGAKSARILKGLIKKIEVAALEEFSPIQHLDNVETIAAFAHDIGTVKNAALNTAALSDIAQARPAPTPPEAPKLKSFWDL